MRESFVLVIDDKSDPSWPGDEPESIEAESGATGPRQDPKGLPACTAEGVQKPGPEGILCTHSYSSF